MVVVVEVQLNYYSLGLLLLFLFRGSVNTCGHHSVYVLTVLEDGNTVRIQTSSMFGLKCSRHHGRLRCTSTMNTPLGYIDKCIQSPQHYVFRIIDFGVVMIVTL